MLMHVYRLQIPLKRFYRYNLVPTLDFDENGYVLFFFVVL